MPLANFDPPGNLTDFNDEGRAEWHEYMDEVAEAVVIGDGRYENDSPRPGYFNLTRVDLEPDTKTYSVAWMAFPRRVLLDSINERQRWENADASRDVQDEYCEWNVERGRGGKIKRVTFTCEGPEYWKSLARRQPETVLELYKTHISRSVKHEDLFKPSGAYIARNKWNTDTTNGAMHLVQKNNTLTAEINLAAAATIVRRIDGRELTGKQELIGCSKYGNAFRNSDPHIGGAVNSIARLKAEVSLTNPVGLYFDDLFTPGWVTPDGSSARSYWRYERGEATHPVRAVYEVPKEKGFSVGDITIFGKPIEFGSQIADCISIKLECVAHRFGKSKAKPFTSCANAKKRKAGKRSSSSQAIPSVLKGAASHRG